MTEKEAEAILRVLEDDNRVMYDPADKAIHFI